MTWRDRKKSQVRTSDAVAPFIELDLLSSDERFLQGTSYAHSSYCTLELHGRRGVVQAAGRKFVRFGDEGIAEAAVVVGRDFTTDTSGFVDVDQVCGRLGIDGKLTSRTGDFGGCCI